MVEAAGVEPVFRRVYQGFTETWPTCGRRWSTPNLPGPASKLVLANNLPDVFIIPIIHHFQ